MRPRRSSERFLIDLVVFNGDIGECGGLGFFRWKPMETGDGDFLALHSLGLLIGVC